MFITFDTETSGLAPGSICQLSYIKHDGGSSEGVNYFYAVDYVSPSATAVNGLTVEKLAVLSEGRVFADTIETVAADFLAADFLVAHNFTFDLSFMLAEFSRLGRVLRYNKSFCTMKNLTSVCKLRRNSGGYKYPKLSELADFLGLSELSIQMETLRLFGDDACNYHDARFDTVATYMSFMGGRLYSPEIELLLAI